MHPLPANLLIAIPAVVLVGLVALILLRRGARGAVDRELSGAESWIASLIGGGAALSAAACVLSLWTNAVWMSEAEPFRVGGLRYSGVTTPTALEGVDHISASGYESVWMDVIGLPGHARWLFYAEEALPSVAALGISVIVAWLSFTVVRERPFARAFPVGIGISAVAVVLGGVGSQFAGALARSAVLDHLGPEQLVEDNPSVPATESFSAFVLTLDLSPVGWAFGLLLVAAAFQIGNRMQQDTEALV